MYPKLRFKEFSDAWEQRKLEDMASFSKGSGYSKSDLIDSGTPLILYGRLYTKYETVITEVDTYAEEKKGSVFSKGGEVIVPASGETAEDISVASVVEKSEVLLGGDLNVITPSEVLESMFLALNITYGKAHKDMSKLAQGKSVVHLHNADLKTIVLQYPSILEQRKICEFFKSLDNLITLHQRQCETLKKQKQFFLQNMFPKEGESSPKIRFKGFSDSWKQCKLHEICSMNARIGWQNLRTSEFLDSGDYLLITGTDFVNGKVNFKSCHYVDKYRFDQDLKIQVQNGSILITKDGTLGKVAIIEALPKPATLNAGVFNVVIKSKDIDNYYLYQYLKAPFLMNYVNKRSTGGTIKHLNQSILVDFPVLKPSLQEQQKIGAYFERLDNHITLHQRQYEQLVSLKKYLLTKMFI